MAPGVDFAKGRLQFADMLYYKILEDIIEQEVLRLTAKDKQVDLSVSSTSAYTHAAQIETVHVILFKVLLFKCSKYAGPLLIIFVNIFFVFCWVLYYVAFFSDLFCFNKIHPLKMCYCSSVQCIAVQSVSNELLSIFSESSGAGDVSLFVVCLLFGDCFVYIQHTEVRRGDYNPHV